MSNTKSTSKLVVPEAREAMNKFKMEAASDFRVKRHIEFLETLFYQRLRETRKTATLTLKDILNQIQPSDYIGRPVVT